MSTTPGKQPEGLVSHRVNLRKERLEFPPSYVVVGVYRLFTDKNLYIPAWDKCRHGVIRGAAVGVVWAALTFNVQHKFIEIFLTNSPKVTGLSHESVFGYHPPFTVTTYAAVVLISSQITNIIKFFLSRNIRIARERAWDHTVASRGKGPDFWQAYVEEWQRAPIITTSSWDKWLGGWFGRVVVRRVVSIPLSLYPIVGLAFTAYIKAIGTAQYLHKPYFAAKKMTADQVTVFIAERRWDYRAFGFAAALLESIPIIGLVFSISNRIGAAMWAHDLEKRQHEFASGQIKPISPPPTPPAETELKDLSQSTSSMAGSWEYVDPKTE